MAFSIIAASARRVAALGCAALLLTTIAAVAAPQAARAETLPQPSKSYVLYPGKQKTIKFSSSRGKWYSSNTAIAKVTKSGTITAKSPGHCTMKAKRKGRVTVVSVDVGTKIGYKAAKNARADAAQQPKYNQNKRTLKGYRDCSSYVSRCYWDDTATPKRQMFDIGGSAAYGYPDTAADQAEWLNANKLCVAKKGVDAKYLQPGDTIYVYTDKTQKNGRYLNIDHAIIYLGGGMMAQTSSYPTKGLGCISISKYDPKNFYGDIKFIGRPTAQLIMNKTEWTLTKAKGKNHTVALKPKFNKSKATAWSTSNAKVAKVSETGVVTARKKGKCRIYAQVDGKKISCRVTVE